MAVVKLQNITKKFGNITAVHDFNLETEDGEFVVLVGPSGCGKSTTLRMLAGLEDTSGGSITIGDREVQHVAPKDRDIAMVFQNYALYPHMNVYKNMAFSLQLRKMPKSDIEKRVRNAAQILGIEHLLERKPRELSGGQRQRVALGRAIVREPQAFLMDEPLSNLDAKLRVGMRAEISKLHQRLGVTSFYVTHDQIEALTMGQRIVVMRDGWVQQIASPLELYDHPVNRFVAGFIGNPAMNFLRVGVSDDSKQLRGGHFSITVSPRLGEAAQQHHGHEVWAGIRPEHLSACDNNSDANTLTGTVELIEPLGSLTEVQVNVDGTIIVAQIDRDVEISTGEQLSLQVDTSHLHMFDIEGEQSLLLQRQKSAATTSMSVKIGVT